MPFISNCVGFVKFIDIIFTEVKYCCLGDDMQKNKGFTLIELIVTIAVMTIIAILAAPSFGDMLKKQNLNKSSKELIATLNQARAKAALERREITVELLSSDANTESSMNWMPVGKANLKTGTSTEIVFMPNGLVKDPSTNQVIAGDTAFVICDDVSGSNNSKQITISRMGTIHQIVEGDCS